MDRSILKKITLSLVIYLCVCWGITLLQVFFFPAPRILLILFFLPVGGIVAIAYFLYYVVIRRRWGAAAVTAVFTVLLILNVYVVFQPLEKYDLLKYQLTKDSYHQAAQIVLEDIQDEPDTDGYKHYENDGQIKGFPGRYDITYIKFNENIMINFVTSNSLFTMSGYAYYSGPDILNYMDDPQFYLPGGRANIKVYDERVQLKDPNWIYVIWC